MANDSASIGGRAGAPGSAPRDSVAGLDLGAALVASVDEPEEQVAAARAHWRVAAFATLAQLVDSMRKAERKGCANG